MAATHTLFYKKVGNWPTQRSMHRKAFFNTTPRFGGRGGARGYPMKLLHISYNLIAEAEMLSLSVYEPIAIKKIAWGRPPPNLAEGSS